MGHKMSRISEPNFADTDMGTISYELYIENKTAYLRNTVSKKLTYHIVCIDKDEEFIRIEAIHFKDKKRMYVSDIKNFDSVKMREVLPECYV